MKTLRRRHLGEWCLLRATVLAAAGLPLTLRPGLAWILSLLAFDVLRVRRRVVEHNLRVAYGTELTDRDRLRIGRRCYQQLAMGAFELAALTRMSPQALVAACPVEGVEHLEHAQRSGRGAILVSGHVGNWEYLAGALAARGLPVTAVGAPMHNPAVDRWLRDLRARFGIDLIRTGRSSGRAALKVLRSGGLLLLLIDQDARRQGVFVEFFSTPVSTHTGAAMLSLRTEAPIVPCRIVRTGLTHAVRVYPPREPGACPDGAESVRRMTQEITSLLEAWIREDPSAWFWPHRRFKTRPLPGMLDSDREGGILHGTDTAHHQA